MRRHVALVASVLLLLTACGAPTETTTPTATSPAGTAPAASTPGGTQPAATTPAAVTSKDTMIIAIPGTPPGIDPDLQAAPQMFTIGAQLYGELGLRWGRAPYTAQQTIADPNKVPGFWVADTDQTKLTPGIIQSCTLAPDGSKVTLSLRQGVMSPYGNEFTTDDILWGIQRSVAHNFIGAFFMGVGGAPDPAQWHALDKYTMEIDQANGQSLFNMCGLMAHLGAAPSWFMDSTETKKHATADDPWAGDWVNHYGSWYGPYYITDWQPDNQVVLEANPNYYLGELPIKKIIYQVVPQSADRIALLEAGTVDLVEGISPTEAEALDSQAGVRPIAVESNKQYFAFMNDSIDPWSNPLVRQAMNYSIDRNSIATNIYHGLATPYEGWLPVNFAGYEPYNTYDFNLQKAKDLLTQAGYPNGFNTELSYSSGAPEEEQVAIAWQTSLAQIGVNLTLKKITPTAISQMVVGGTATNFTFAFWEDAPFLSRPGFLVAAVVSVHGQCQMVPFRQ